MTLADITPALPEIFMAVAALVLLLYGTFRGDRALREIASTAVLVLLVALYFVWQLPAEPTIIFNGLFITDGFSQFIKTILLIGAALAITMGETYAEREGMYRFEYPLLILLATLGTMCMVSANDLLSLYLGLELQALSLYILASFKRDDMRSSEAGLKYFVLGALASGLTLYGMSLVYGFVGTTNFPQLANALRVAELPSMGAVLGLVFIMAGMAFKISAVPFHMWTPDVYEGAPTSVTAFFATVPKVAALAVIIRLLAEPFAALSGMLQNVLVLLAVLSMLLGAFAALKQTNIKRLMAYSSIGHMGYALVGLAAGGEAGLRAVLIYLAIYFIMSLGVFAVILTLRRGGKMVEEISDLSGLGKDHPVVALVMVILMFSMAGVPPMAGFFGKFYVFMAALQAELVWLAIVGVLTSAVAAYYYLRIIKVMYFDEATKGVVDPVPERTIQAVLLIAGVYMLVFAFYPLPVLDAASVAAKGLLS